MPPPEPPKAGPRDLGAVARPLGYAEARQSLHSLFVGLAKLCRSKVEWQDSDFDAAGDAFAQLANGLVPGLRIALRLVAPIVLLGALAQLTGQLLEGTEWWPAWRERRRQRQAERAQTRAQAEQGRAAAATSEAAPAPPETVTAPPNDLDGAQTQPPPPLPRRGPALVHLR